MTISRIGLAPSAVRLFVEGLTKDSPDDRLREVAPGFPVFRVVAVP